MTDSNRHIKAIEEFERAFSQPKPILKVQFDQHEEVEEPIDVLVKNRIRVLRKPKEFFGIDWLDQLDNQNELKSFYSWVAEAKLFIPRRPWSCETIPLINFLRPEKIEKHTSLYEPGGKLGYIIDLNKSKKIYRTHDKWVAFALICSEHPSCLTTFLDGENAGAIYCLTIEPEHKILKPVAKSFNALLGKIGKDPLKFLHLVNAQVPICRNDGFSYAYHPIDYIPSKELEPELA